MIFLDLPVTLIPIRRVEMGDNQTIMTAPPTTRTGRSQISVHIQAEVMSAEAARRQV